MFDDILGKKENQLAMICCSSCAHGAAARAAQGWKDCPKDHKKCFQDGKTMEYKGWGRFNPVYRYSQWELFQ